MVIDEEEPISGDNSPVGLGYAAGDEGLHHDDCLPRMRGVLIVDHGESQAADILIQVDNQGNTVPDSQLLNRLQRTGPEALCRQPEETLRSRVFQVYFRFCLESSLSRTTVILP